MKQISFGFCKNYKNSFGGGLLVGKRKTKRPLSTKKPIHLILKSMHKGVFVPGNQSLEKLIFSQAKKFNIQIYEFALNWSHIHLVIRLKNQNDYHKFIRSMTSIIAQKIKMKYCATGRHYEKTFELRPFTRILSWGRDFKNTIHYQVLNQLEARGLVVRKKKCSKIHIKHQNKNLKSVVN
jgi:hypothetical protein